MKEEPGKMFVGGLAWSTTTSKLKDYFSKFGEIMDCSVIYDKVTENSKGFGFIKFRDPESVNNVIKSRPHILDDKQIDPKPCTTKEVQKEKQRAELVQVAKFKIFVGGVAQTTTEEKIRQYFEKYGSVSDVLFAINKEDNKNKGFCFVTFDREDAATKAVEVHFHNIDGRRVEVKRAQPRIQLNNSAKKNSYDSSMFNQYGYPAGPWGPMSWGGSYGMDGGMVGPSGGYMADPSYSSSYYPQATSYLGYNESPAAFYPDMNNYPQMQSASTTSKSSKSSSDSRSYHPYKR